jgi:hypothetical protein
MCPEQPSEEEPQEESGHWEPYSYYHKNLRLWFLAYGIGTPVFLVQYPGALDTLKSQGILRSVTVLFLAGVVVQVFAALTYKTAMWYLYMRDLKRLARTSWRVRLSGWVSIAYWLEFLFDASTLVLFSAATWLTVVNVT